MWVLNCGGIFPCGVFETREKAEEVIYKYKLSGTLTKYSLNTTAFDWAVENGHFTPKNEQQRSPDFIGKFSSAYQEHYHYEDGK